MITIKDWMETVGYRITEGSDYGWNCYGENSYCLDSWNRIQEGNSLSIVFDTITQTVYEVQAHDYLNHRSYRIINPEYQEAYRREAKVRDVDPDCAWDNVNYVDLETDEDWMEKAQAIVDGVDYDTRVQIPIELPESDLLELFKLAHKRDITLNQLVEEIIIKQCQSILST